MNEKSRAYRLAPYVGGLSLGLLLITATIGQADEPDCSNCRAYWAWYYTQPGHDCYLNPTKGCLEPLLQDRCKDVCKDGGASFPTCVGELGPPPNTCENNAMSVCTTGTLGKQCDSKDTTRLCKTVQVFPPVIVSVCNATCECTSP